LRKM